MARCIATDASTLGVRASAIKGAVPTGRHRVSGVDRYPLPYGILKAGVWFLRGRLLIVTPVHSHNRRYQAETLLIALFSFAVPGPS